MSIHKSVLTLIPVSDEAPPKMRSLLIGWNNIDSDPKTYSIGWLSLTGNWYTIQGQVKDPPTHWAPLDCLRMEWP